MQIFPRANRRSVLIGALASIFLATAMISDAAVAGEGAGPSASAPSKSDAAAAVPGRRTFWQEQFTKRPLAWLDPFDHDRDTLARVYSLRNEGEFNYLHARYDGTAKDRPPAMHYGQPFQQNPAPLDRVASLEWKWRVTRHPAVKDDAWEDCAAGTHQHGLLQVPLRNDPAGSEWRQESVDLCALYRKEYGACEGQKVLYVGVVTDADGTKTVAEADYANFTLVAR